MSDPSGSDQALEEARTFLRAEVAKSTQSAVARRVGVGRDVIRRLLAGKTLYGDNRETILRHVDEALRPPAPKDAATGGRIVTDYQLGVISGQARSVMRLLTMAQEEQARVIRDLDTIGGSPARVVYTTGPSDPSELERTALDTVRAEAERTTRGSEGPPENAATSG